MKGHSSRVLSNYQSKQEYKMMSQLQIVRQELKDQAYTSLVSETEITNIQLFEMLDLITKKEIQDISYVLKPNQLLYDSICGINSLLAGLARAIPQEYAAIRVKDWMQSQGLFCVNAKLLFTELKQLQFNLFKRKITVINIQEAKRYQRIDLQYIQAKYRELSIAEKLALILSYALKYCNLFQSVEKSNQLYDKSIRVQTQQSPERDNQFEVEFLVASGQKGPHDFRSPNGQTLSPEASHQPQRGPKTPTKLHLKTFNEYRRSLSNTGRASLYSSTASKIAARSPQFGQRVSQVKEMQAHKPNAKVRKMEKQRPRKPKTPPPQPQLPQQREIDLELLEHQIVSAFETCESEEKDQTNWLQVERALKQELSQTEKEIQRLHMYSKRLQWEEERKIKQSLRAQQSAVQKEQLDWNQKYLENKSEFREQMKWQTRESDLQNASLKISLFSSRQEFKKDKLEFEEDFKYKEIQSLHKELHRRVQERETLRRDVEKLQRLVFEGI